MSIVAIALIVFPASILIFNNINGLISIYFFLAGSFLYLKNRKTAPQPSRDETLLYFAASLFCWVSIIITYNLSDNFDSSSRFLYLFAIIPSYIFLKNTRIKLHFFWYGLTLGAFITAGMAIYEVFISHADRARGITHPIIFGDLALIMGVMTLAGAGWFRSQAKWQLLLPGLALICGVLASALAAARGGWVAIPFLLLIFLWYIKDIFSFRQKITLITVFILILSALYFTPQTRVSYQIDRTIDSIKLYINSDINSPHRSTSVGTRFEMWQASISIFQQHPLAGVGWGNYKKNASLLVQQGLRNESAAAFEHPHNQFLSALVKGGLLSFFSLILLFGILSIYFIKKISRGKNSDVRQLALAGLVLVTGFVFFGQSEAIFERTRPISFFAFYIAVIMAIIYQQQRLTPKQTFNRKHSLSVTVITKNEEDRLDACLQSVHNWADEIIVLDSGSTDDTVNIAKRYTDKVFETDWPGYGIQKQRALEKASCEWVLSLDADERVTPELRADIDEVLSEEQPKHNGYHTPWAVMLYGHRMDFGRSARAPLRLFKREGSRFSDDQVHERIILPDSKSTRKLEGRLLHFTHRDFGHGLLKSRQYAWLGSQKYFQQNRWGGGLIGATLRAFWTFFLIYFLRLGILDGAAGFLSAASYSQNSFNKYAGLWSLQREARRHKTINN